MKLQGYNESRFYGRYNDFFAFVWWLFIANWAIFSGIPRLSQLTTTELQILTFA
jgi:hypothetical protein